MRAAIGATAHLLILAACSDAIEPTQPLDKPAFSEAAAGTSSARSTAPSANSFTKRPPNMSLVADNPFSVLQPSGWYHYSPAKLISIQSLQQTPLSPPKVIRFRYPKGFSGVGVGPGAVGYGYLERPMKVSGRPVKELFIGLHWRINPNWQQPTGGRSKIFYVYQQVNYTYRNLVSPQINGTGAGPWGVALEISPQNRSHTTYSNYPLHPGRWYKMEFYFKKSSASGVADGVLRWWINGTLVINRTGVVISHNPFSELHINPVWGSSSVIPKQQEDFMEFDHVQLFGR